MAKVRSMPTAASAVDDPRVGAEFAEGRRLRLDRGVGGQRVGDRDVLRVDRGVGDHAVRVVGGGQGIGDRVFGLAGIVLGWIGGRGNRHVG